MPNAILRIDAAPVTIAADLISAVGIVPVTGRVIRCSYIPRSDITGANSTDSRTFTLYNRSTAGAGTTVVATLAMVLGVNGVAHAPKIIALSATAANLLVTAGDVLDWESLAVTAAGGLVDPGGTVEVEIQPTLI